jgi:hypothetical protein
LTQTPSASGKDVHPRFWLGFVPWLLFTLVAHRDSLEAAVVVGIATALVVSLPSFAAGRPKTLEVATIVFFLVLAVVIFATEPGPTSFLDRYARALAAGGLAIIAFGSLALGTPFTEQYAREQVPRERWDSPLFKSLNRRFTALWGAVFVAMACSHVVAGAIDTHRAETIFNWVIPIALVVWAVKYMQDARDGSSAEQDQTKP